MPKDVYDETDDQLKRARARMKRICATPEEAELYRHAPNAARDNRHPGIPLEDYGELLDN